MIDIDIQISISERSSGWATNYRGGEFGATFPFFSFEKYWSLVILYFVFCFVCILSKQPNKFEKKKHLSTSCLKFSFNYFWINGFEIWGFPYFRFFTFNFSNNWSFDSILVNFFRYHPAWTKVRVSEIFFTIEWKVNFDKIPKLTFSPYGKNHIQKNVSIWVVFTKWWKC